MAQVSPNQTVASNVSAPMQKSSVPMVGLVVSIIHFLFVIPSLLYVAAIPFLFNDTGGPLPSWLGLWVFVFAVALPAYLIAILVLSILSIRQHGAHASRYKKPLKILLLVEAVIAGLLMLGYIVYTIIYAVQLANTFR